MQDFFITKFYIKKVRHLENIYIELSDTEKKHLIITGKNGSGKTSLINCFESIFVARYLWRESSGQHSKNCFNMEYDYDSGIEVYSSLQLSDFSHSSFFDDYVFATLHANRALNLDLPRAIETIDVGSSVLASHSFLKYLLYLNYQKMNAIMSKDTDEERKIQQWFDMFLDTLRDIYDCPELELKHNSKDLSYRIHMPGREPFGLHEMADGYSSFIHIVLELMMKMENNASLTYDMPGIVFIDEIETHLHVELQKRVLPFLTRMFPRIQFIVTTHSPFVITSTPNAVVYDLETTD